MLGAKGFQKGNQEAKKGLHPIKTITWIVDDKGCWNCNSHSLDKDGYPRKSFYIKNTKRVKNVAISKLMYEKYIGPIKEGYLMLHKCDNSTCINPDHLYQGTIKDNVRDSVQRGRRPDQYGEKNPRAKLNEEKVKMILKDTCSIKYIAIKYNVSRATIYLIKKRKNWSKVCL